jgi:hypothetical protein
MCTHADNQQLCLANIKRIYVWLPPHAQCNSESIKAYHSYMSSSGCLAARPHPDYFII